jgi:serine/threonine protein kinase
VSDSSPPSPSSCSHHCLSNYRGSFAVVRVGVSFKTKNKVAIKEIPMQDLLPEQKEDLDKEISILSQFNHKNIVRLFEIYKESQATYMV